MSELDAGTVVDGHYEVTSAVGSGGLGTVYLARDVKDDSTVALKMLNIEGKEAQRRFLREFNILSHIRHPRIVRSYRWGVYEGMPYFSMDYISGRTLSDVIDSAEGRKTLRTLWFGPFVRQIGAGLAHIHKNGLVHRDLKPSNIMVSAVEGEPDVTILDLGLARFQDSRELRLTQPGTTTGTVEYMSPEQIRGTAVDPRSDLYSLGVIIYEILTGAPPFTGESPASVMFQHLRDRPRPPRPYTDVPFSCIEESVMKLLEKEPIDRYSSVGSLLHDLSDRAEAASDEERGNATVSIPPVQDAGDAPIAMSHAPVLQPQFQGRDKEMKALCEFLRETGDGVGRMVLVSGQAGIGKSQVLEEFQAEARVHGMRILTGHCHQSGGRAFGPFLEALRVLTETPGMQGSDVGKAIRRMLVQLERPVATGKRDSYSVMEILSGIFVDLSRKTPVLVCIEDLQWVDDLSLRFLDFMRRDPDPTPLVFALACRTEDEDPLPARIEAVIKGADVPSVVHLQLEPLGFEESTSLAASMLGELAVPEAEALRIYEETGGNPLFVIELIRSSIEGGAIFQDIAGRWTWLKSQDWPMPSGIDQAIEWRLGRLRSTQRRALEYASIFRWAFPFDLISEVWRGDELELMEALEGLVRLGLLRALEDSEGRYRFTHGLIQRTIYERISERKRVLLHLEAGRALEALIETDGTEALDDLAYHFLRSSDLERMARYVTASGLLALRMHDFSHALEQFEAVLEKGAFSPDAPGGISRGSVAHLDFLCAYAEALTGCDRDENARVELKKTMEWFSCETQAQKAKALRILGISHTNSGNIKRAKSVWLEALELYRNLRDDENELIVMGLLSNVCLELGDRDEALRYCDSAADKCREMGGGIYEARALINLAFAADITYQIDQAKEFLESSLNLLNLEGGRTYRNSCLYLLARIDFRLGDFDRAEDMFEELREFWRRCGSKRAEAEACHYLGKIALERKDPESAEAHADTAQLLLSDEGSGNEFFGACALLAEALADAGRVHEALRWADRAWPGVEAGGNIRAQVLAARAKSLSAAGRHDAVQSLFEEVLKGEDSPEGPEQVYLFLVAGTYYLERSCSSDARYYLETAKTRGENMGFRYYARQAANLLDNLSERGQKVTYAAELALALSGNHLATLYEVSKDLASVLDLNELLDRTIDRLMKVSRAECAMIALQDQEACGIQVARAHNMKDAVTREISRGIVNMAMHRNEVIFSLDAQVDERFRRQESVVNYGIRSVFCVPLHHVESGVIGALYLDHRTLEDLFTDEDRAFLSAFANLVSVAVVNARKYSQIEERARFFQKQFEERYRLGELVGRGQAMLEVFNLLEHAGQSDVTVLIQGETGTGKELAARAIHSQSERNEHPFLSANCAALTPELLQSELFGHKKGAFTGAVSDRKGLFESADGGTILLDEIGDASPQLQSSLLRVLQEGEIQRVGETGIRIVDVRVIAATNRDLEADVRNGLFREDLYYRLRVLQIEMPPLRRHIEDVPLLSEHLLKRICADQNKAVTGFTVGAMRALMDHGWPGNVRELENEIKRAVVLVKEGRDVTAGLFSEKIGLLQPVNEGERGYFKARVAALEKRMIIEALEQHSGNITRAAALLALSRNGLQKMMIRHGLRDGT